ncbi:MAG TPA: hypothetical protein VKA97_00965 [Pyrinomonadaceae bacterium]|nr:hypothetical protein [Pyrinomonadaceae bacterium]
MNKFLRKHMLQHAHPAKFVAELMGIMWGIYFLWQQNWIGAVVSSVLLFLSSTLITWNKSMNYLAATPLGRVMLVYATPLTFLIYNLSALPVIYGAWTHQVIYILAGYSIMLLPHLWMWKK